MTANSLHGQDLQQVKKAKPFGFYGSASVSGGPYIYIGNGTPRNNPYWWNISGSPTITIYGLQLPFTFSVGSQQQRSFSQPFNRVGVSPHYKWLTLHAGYRSMRFNPYVVSGLQFLGGGIELNPKGFRFGAFYGRYSKPVVFDSLASLSPVSAYRRIGYGVKIGAGNKRSYFDVMFFRAYDDTTSIPHQPAQQVSPEENLVAGISGRIAIGRHISWQMDAAASLTNPDIRLPVLFPDLSTRITSVFNPRLGATLLFAGNSSLQFTYRYFGLRFVFRQVDPNYKSLGAYYQQSDLRALTVEPSVKLFKGRFRLNASIGRQQDNLYNRKSFTSIRTIGSATASITFSKRYSTDLSFSNYGLAQQAGIQVLNDTFRVAQVNRSFSMGHHYTVMNKIRVLSLNMSSSYQQLRDLNTFATFNATENEVWYANLMANRIRQRDQHSVNAGLNMSKNHYSGGTSILVGPTIGTGKSFLKNKLQANINLTYNRGFTNGKSSGATVNIYGMGQYRLSPMHQFQLTLNVLNNSTTFVSTTKFTEIRLMAGYTFIFQPKGH